MKAAALLLLVWAGPARAWESHGELTRLALAGLPGVDAVVVAQTLEDYLRAAGKTGGAAAFLAEHKLNPNARFPYRAGETSGGTLSLLDVAGAYADEPDWDIDDDVFAHYPELWDDAYRYMGGRSGPQTRAIRHMYWPGGYFSEPTPPSRAPTRNARPLGLAPERAELFFKLSREAFASGHPYWGARFLAWSLHYLEDLTQPFHAAQLPSTELVRFKPGGLDVDVEKTTRVVVYYHLAIDGFTGAGHRGQLGADVKKRLEAALAGADSAPVPDARAAAVATAHEASARAKRTSRDAIAFFPDETDAGLADPVGRVYTPGFWAECVARRSVDPDSAEAFLTDVEDGLRDFGPRARGLTAAALAEGKRAPAPADTRLGGRVGSILQRAIIFP